MWPLNPRIVSVPLYTDKEIRSERMEKQVHHYCFMNDILNNKKASLMRIISFVVEETDVIYLKSITANILKEYIGYHKFFGFKQQSFQQVIKDIRIFRDFLNYYYEDMNINLDFSILNYNFWINIDLNN